MARIYSNAATTTLFNLGQNLIDIANAVDNGTILKQETLTIDYDSQTDFTITSVPNGNKVLLSLNGQLLTDGADYTLTDTTITILSNELETSDVLVVSYLA